jgi:hypothetical protein
MTQDEFEQALARELARRGGLFDPADVREFAARVWPEAQKDPRPARWVDEFIDRGHLDARG